MSRRSDSRARRGKPPCFARTQDPVGSRPGSVNRCLPPQVEAPPPSPAQLLFDHALALEQQTDFFSDLAREAQVRGEALHATRTGMQAQEIQADGLERRDGVGEALLDQLALRGKVREDAVVAAAHATAGPGAAGVAPTPPAAPLPLPRPRLPIVCAAAARAGAGWPPPPPRPPPR